HITALSPASSGPFLNSAEQSREADESGNGEEFDLLDSIELCVLPTISITPQQQTYSTSVSGFSPATPYVSSKSAAKKQKAVFSSTSELTSSTYFPTSPTYSPTSPTYSPTSPTYSATQYENCPYTADCDLMLNRTPATLVFGTNDRDNTRPVYTPNFPSVPLMSTTTSSPFLFGASSVETTAPSFGSAAAAAPQLQSFGFSSPNQQQPPHPQSFGSTTTLSMDYQPKQMVTKQNRGAQRHSKKMSTVEINQGTEQYQRQAMPPAPQMSDLNKSIQATGYFPSLFENESFYDKSSAASTSLLGKIKNVVTSGISSLGFTSRQNMQLQQGGEDFQRGLSPRSVSSRRGGFSELERGRGAMSNKGKQAAHAARFTDTRADEQARSCHSPVPLPDLETDSPPLQSIVQRSENELSSLTETRKANKSASKGYLHKTDALRSKKNLLPPPQEEEQKVYHVNICDLLLLDVAPLSLGIELVSGEYVAVIQRNTTIPTKNWAIFTNAFAGQTTATVKIFEGEHRLTKYNNYLGEFTLEKLSKNFASETLNITITMDIDANGILNVTAEEQASRVKKSIAITDDKGRLTRDFIEQHVRFVESLPSADHDSSTPLLDQMHRRMMTAELIDSIFQLQNDDGSFSFTKDLQAIFNNIDFGIVQQHLTEQGLNSFAEKIRNEINDLICTTVIVIYIISQSELSLTLTFPLDIHSIRNLVEQIKNNGKKIDPIMENYRREYGMAFDYVLKMRDKNSMYCTQLELGSTWELYIQKTLLGLDNSGDHGITLVVH
ncbi:unnamed protein product, partial [Didymodactylos carnosus]